MEAYSKAGGPPRPGSRLTAHWTRDKSYSVQFGHRNCGLVINAARFGLARGGFSFLTWRACWQISLQAKKGHWPRLCLSVGSCTLCVNVYTCVRHSWAGSWDRVSSAPMPCCASVTSNNLQWQCHQALGQAHGRDLSATIFLLWFLFLFPEWWPLLVFGNRCSLLTPSFLVMSGMRVGQRDPDGLQTLSQDSSGPASWVEGTGMVGEIPGTGKEASYHGSERPRIPPGASQSPHGSACAR